MKTKTTLSSLAAALVLVACQNLTQTERAQQDAQATETELRLMQGQLGNVRTLLSHQPPDSPSHQQLNIQVALLQRQVASLQDRLGAANRSASSAVAAARRRGVRRHEPGSILLVFNPGITGLLLVRSHWRLEWLLQLRMRHMR